jgi:hypothetical protein
LAKHSSRILEMARRGAEYRYQELQAELASLVQSFPHLGAGRGRRGRRGRLLFGGASAIANDSASGGRKRSHMSAAARKAQSIRMKKYWAERRKAKGK